MLINQILKRPGRTILTLIAVMSSCALLISMLSITEGMRNNNTQWIEQGKDDIVITTASYGGNIYSGHEIMDELSRDLRNISALSPILVSSMRLKINDEWSSIIAIGLDPSLVGQFLMDNGKIELYGIEIDIHKWFSTTGDGYYSNGSYGGPFTGETLINRRLMESAGLQIGDSLGLGQEMENGTRFTIDGYFSSPLTGEGLIGIGIQGIVLFHLSEMQSLLAYNSNNITLAQKDIISSLALSISKERRDSKSIEEITRSLSDRYPAYLVMNKNDRLSELEEQSIIADMFYGAAGTVTLIIGLLFVACIMIMNIYDQQKWIGVLRAIGISKRRIFQRVFIETLILISIGVILGLVLGYFTASYTGDYLSTKYGWDEQITSFTPALVIRTVAYIMLIASIFALIPAFKATRVEIISAIRGN